MPAGWRSASESVEQRGVRGGLPDWRPQRLPIPIRSSDVRERRSSQCCGAQRLGSADSSAPQTAGTVQAFPCCDGPSPELRRSLEVADVAHEGVSTPERHIYRDSGVAVDEVDRPMRLGFGETPSWKMPAPSPQRLSTSPERPSHRECCSKTMAVAPEPSSPREPRRGGAAAVAAAAAATAAAVALAAGAPIPANGSTEVAADGPRHRSDAGAPGVLVRSPRRSQAVLQASRSALPLPPVLSPRLGAGGTSPRGGQASPRVGAPPRSPLSPRSPRCRSHQRPSLPARPCGRRMLGGQVLQPGAVGGA